MEQALVNEYLSIGHQIKQMRELMGMSQSQLAKRSAMNQSAVAAIESGKRVDLQLSTVQRLAAGLNGRLILGLVPETNIQKWPARSFLPQRALLQSKCNYQMRNLSRSKSTKQKKTF